MIYVLFPSTPERKERLAVAMESIRNSICDQEIEIKVDISEGEGANKPTLRLINSVDGLVICLGDDSTVEPDTIQKLYNAYIREFPDQDGMCSPPNCDNFLAHSNTMRKYWHPDYIHLYADRDFFDTMTFKKKVFRVLDAVIHHNHYTKNATLDDDTYRFGEKNREADRILYEKRRARNFNLDL